MGNYAYLVMVNGDANNNKYYRMTEQGSTFLAEYGRVGATSQRKNYPMTRWYEIYNQKIRKGYTDQTHLHVAPKVVIGGGDYKEIEDSAVRWLVNVLLSSSRQYIKQNYRASSDEVTEAMVREAKKILNSLRMDMSKWYFNDQLIQLFSVIPRKMSDVQPYLANQGTPEEYSKIVQREQHLLEAMAGQVYTNAMASQLDEAGTRREEKNILDSMGLSIRPCTEKENAEIIKYMTPESAMHFDKAFRVYNKKVSERLDAYMAEQHIRKAHYLYHGSATQNFWNIITMGLDINPNAITAGKMFGNGTYFANRAKKSIRYTDLPGQNNLHSPSSSQSFLSVFKVAYKKAYDIHTWENEHTKLNYNKVRALGCDAVFAHKGQSLVNDEIIVYQNCQSAPQYLIAMK